MRNVAILVLVLFGCGPAPRPNTGEGFDAAGGRDAAVTDSGDAPVGPDAAVHILVYAHTATTLYSIDPDTLVLALVGDFQWPAGTTDQMTDIAIDKTNVMIGVSFTNVYRVDPVTAKATLLSGGLGQTFNGLSFVPAAMVGQTGDDVLVATRNQDGAVFRVDPMTGMATQIGDMGSFTSSGDLVAIDGFGTVQTTTGTTADQLVQLTTGTFAATPIGTGIGFTQIWGIAYAKGKIFGFTDSGQFILIDPITGVGSLVNQTSQQWWGAAVTTLAPVIE